MFSADQYELIDFGDGRKLERFGPYVLDRPSAAAEDVHRVDEAAWALSTASFRCGNESTDQRGKRGQWRSEGRLPEEWRIEHGPLSFLVRPTGFGHLGVFPEQASNWDWIAKQVTKAANPLKILNLFAYTGGSTMAAAAAGAEVVHVDSARNTVAWARRNVESAGLGERPIRWIVEDARKFVRREVTRGNQYDAVILDPPSYGKGPTGETWKLNDDLMTLLRDCATLTRHSRRFLLLTCHSPGFGPADAEAFFAEAVFGSCSAGAQAKRLVIKTRSGRKLNAGVVARWP